MFSSSAYDWFFSESHKKIPINLFLLKKLLKIGGGEW